MPNPTVETTSVNLVYLLNTDRCSPRLKDVVVREFRQLWDVLSNVEAMGVSFLAESNRTVDSIILKGKDSENLKTGLARSYSCHKVVLLNSFKLNPTVK